jgi:hypothetical protein
MMSDSETTRIVIEDYSATGSSIYFSLRQRLTLEQVEGLRYIDGVVRYETHDYTVHINTGDAFDFSEIAPRALIVLADALNTDLEHLEVVADSTFRNDQPRADQALTDARMLDHHTKVAQLNGELGRIDQEIRQRQGYIKQWRARKREINEELKGLGEL